MDIYQGLNKRAVVKILLNEVAALKELGCSWDFISKQLNTNTGQNFNAETLRKSFSNLRHNIDEELKNKYVCQFRETIALKPNIFFKEVKRHPVQETPIKQSAQAPITQTPLFTEIPDAGDEIFLKDERIYQFADDDNNISSRPFEWVIEAVKTKLGNNDDANFIFIPDGRQGKTTIRVGNIPLAKQKMIAKGAIKSWEDFKKN